MPSHRYPLIAWFQGKIFQLRSSGSGVLIIMFVVVSVIMTTCTVSDRSAREGAVPEMATITGFGAYEGRWYVGHVRVSAEDAKGVTGEILVLPRQIAGCKVGDKIRAKRSGIALYLSPAPCPIGSGRS
ncbi:hypothetical protein ASE00_01300 [Sphingomonas sp. Root710]|nr:hypothetical protein ASE00_01300 [Sphingomonas sp. Root710]